MIETTSSTSSRVGAVGRYELHDTVQAVPRPNIEIPRVEAAKRMAITAFGRKPRLPMFNPPVARIVVIGQLDNKN